MDRIYFKKISMLEEAFYKRRLRFLVGDSSLCRMNETFRVYLCQGPIKKQKCYLALEKDNIWFVNLMTKKRTYLGDLNNLQDFDYRMLRMYLGRINRATIKEDLAKIS